MSNPRIAYRLASERASLPPLRGKRLLVHVVVNLEAWRFDEPMPRTILTPPRGEPALPDVPNFSWFEYGMRCGFPRILGTLKEHEIRASAAINSEVIDFYPAAAAQVLAAGWEFVAHGVRQQTAHAVPDEMAMIVEALDRIESFAGRRPTGWLGPGLAETADTLDLLAEAGIEYVLDWPVDDLPEWIVTKSGRIVAVPYSLELNDSVIHAVERNPSAELYERVRRTLDVFDTETVDQVRTLTIPLHPHLMGVPHRIGTLHETLDLLTSHQSAVFVTGEQITCWFREAEQG